MPFVANEIIDYEETVSVSHAHEVSPVRISSWNTSCTICISLSQVLTFFENNRNLFLSWERSCVSQKVIVNYHFLRKVILLSTPGTLVPLCERICSKDRRVPVIWRGSSTFFHFYYHLIVSWGAVCLCNLCTAYPRSCHLIFTLCATSSIGSFSKQNNESNLYIYMFVEYLPSLKAWSNTFQIFQFWH